MGVALTEKQLKKLLNDLMDLHNNLHLWCNRGWTSKELGAKEMVSSPKGLPSIVFGPNMKKMFEDGTMDKDELVKKLKEMELETE